MPSTTALVTAMQTLVNGVQSASQLMGDTATSSSAQVTVAELAVAATAVTLGEQVTGLGAMIAAVQTALTALEVDAGICAARVELRAQIQAASEAISIGMKFMTANGDSTWIPPWFGS